MNYEHFMNTFSQQERSYLSGVLFTSWEMGSLRDYFKCKNKNVENKSWMPVSKTVETARFSKTLQDATCKHLI